MRTSFFAFASLILLACSGSSSTVPDTSSSSSGGTGVISPTDPTPTDPVPSDPKPQPKPTDPVPSGPPATAADCDSLAAVFCPKAEACNHLVSILSGAACEERVAGICKAHLSAPGTGFTKTALTSCSAAYTTLTCDQAFGEVQPAACNFKGTLALNTACAFDDQCASGSCAGNDDDKCGTCSSKPSTPSVPKAGLGESCDNSGQTALQCNTALGLWCDAGTDKCTEIPIVALGQECGYIDESIVLCAAGGTCKYGSAGTGSCVAEKAIGASCSASSGYNECTFGTSCISGKCAYPTAAAICK